MGDQEKWNKGGSGIKKGSPSFPELSDRTIKIRGNSMDYSYGGLYFFSAIFQGNMALLALVGVFAIFRLQQLDISIRSELERLIILIRSFHAYNSWPYSPIYLMGTVDFSKLRNAIEDAIKESGNYSEHREVIEELKQITVSPVYKNGCANYDILNKRIQETKKSFRKPFYFTIVVIIISLIFLPLAQYMHNNYHIIEVVAIIITIEPLAKVSVIPEMFYRGYGFL